MASSSNTSSSTSGGIGFCGLLTILFLGLKLGGVIAWSWLWVLAPLWLPTAIALAVVVVILAVVFFAKLITMFCEDVIAKGKRKRQRDCARAT